MHSSPRRRAAAVIGSVLAVSALATNPPASALEGFELERVAGGDRYATAAAVALDAFGTGADAAVVARGDDFPDALAGSYLAGVLGAPLLLTLPGDLPDVTAEALDTLGADTVYLLGGTGAISEAVAEEAAGEGLPPRTVERVAGTNRYATAAEIAMGQDAAGIGEIDGARTALLASGQGFADALAAGPMSFAEQLPVLLTPSGSLAPEAAAAVDELEIEHVVVIGGTGAIADSVLTAVAATGATTERVAGTSRYSTATEVADFMLDHFAGTDDSAVDLATGEGFADALAAGPTAGQSSRPLLLTTTAALAPEAATWLEDHAATLEGGRVFGGTGAVSNAAVDSAEDAAAGEPAAPGTAGQLTAIDRAANSYRIVADGATVSTTATYADADTFLVDGAIATVGGFESNASPGDRIAYTPASTGARARHELTNVAAGSITSGTVGNVDLEEQELDFISPVNGDAIRVDVSWAGALYTVGGQAAPVAAFDDDLNEGDTLAISGTGTQTTYALTNAEVSGTAASITAGANPLLPSTNLTVGALGDDPAGDGDSVFIANGDLASTDSFSVDGQASDYDAFAEALTTGDAVTYRRVGGVETFGLVNRAPSTLTGKGADGITTTTGPLPDQAAGGSFTLVTASGPEEVEYTGGGVFVVDGSVSDESEFESSYSAGDEISYRAVDAPSGTSQRMELTNRALEGPVGPDTINTGDDPALPTEPGPNSYGVLGPDRETVLMQVTYVSGTASANTYFLNGAAVTLAQFEQELDAIAAGTRTGTVQVQTTGTGASAVTQHRLTTVAA